MEGKPSPFFFAFFSRSRRGAPLCRQVPGGAALIGRINIELDILPHLGMMDSSVRHTAERI